MAVSVCVYCGAFPADGMEHWLPRWLGAYQGADTLLDRLCRKCNKLLGDTVDTPMSRMGPEALDRYRYQIEAVTPTGRRRILTATRLSEPSRQPLRRRQCLALKSHC